MLWRSRIAPQSSYDGSDGVPPGWENGIDRTADPGEDAVRREIIERVRCEVHALPDKYREVVYLYYTAELAIREIAACLSVPENTVKTRLRKARQLLKERLEALGYEG